MSVVDIAKGAYEAAKRIKDISDRLKNAEMQNAVAELIGQVADLRVQIAQLQEEKIGLQQEVDRLKHVKDIRTKLQRREGAYYLKESVDGYHEGPYCIACMDQKGILQTVTWRRITNFGPAWECPGCGAKVHAHGP